jgi:uncharacterized membrane protein
MRRVLLAGFFYGMPLTNWLGWLLTGLVVARTMLAIVPPSGWSERVSSSRLPLVLYAANGVLPLLICAGRGMWWAVVLGAAAMGVPLALAWRRPASAPAARREMPRAAGVAANG